MTNTPSTPRQRRTQAERLEISGRRMLQAATALIAEKGWEATTAADIGRRAGYSRALVHRRYGSKDALLDELFRSEYEDWLNPTPDPAATGLQNVLAPLERITQLFADDPRFLESMFVLSFEAVKRDTPLRPRIAAWMNRISDTVRDGLKKGTSDGSIRPGINTDAAVADIVAATVGIAYGWIVLPDRYDLPRELARLRDRIVRDYGT